MLNLEVQPALSTQDMLVQIPLAILDPASHLYASASYYTAKIWTLFAPSLASAVMAGRQLSLCAS